MVQSQFIQDEQVAATQPEVLVKAPVLNQPVRVLMTYIDQFETGQPAILPVKTTEQLMMVKIIDIILADVQHGQLMIYTQTGIVTSKEPLIHFRQRLANSDFVQVSKHAVLNLNHLITLSDSFSGNLTARLTNQVKTEVSRKYVKSLMTSLGV